MIKGVIVGLSLATTLLGAGPWARAAAADPAARCASLQAPLLPGLVIEAPTLVPAGPAKTGTAASPIDLPAHCLVRATFAARTGAAGQRLGIGMELRLPLEWNGRFLFQGGGGLDGVLAPSYGLISETISRRLSAAVTPWCPPMAVIAAPR